MRNTITIKEIRAKKAKQRDGWRNHDRKAKTRLKEFLLDVMGEEAEESADSDSVPKAAYPYEDECDEIEEKMREEREEYQTGELPKHFFGHNNFVSRTVWIIKRHYSDMDDYPHSTIYTICEGKEEAELILSEMDRIFEMCADLFRKRIEVMGLMPKAPAVASGDEYQEYRKWMDEAETIFKTCFNGYQRKFNCREDSWDWINAYTHEDKKWSSYYEEERQILRLRPSRHYSIHEYEVMAI